MKKLSKTPTSGNTPSRIESTRIGNIFKNGIIHSFTEEHVFCYHHSRTGHSQKLFKVRARDLTPIELTNEILIKCRFSERDGLIYLLPLYLKKASGRYDVVEPKDNEPITYLHELQNLYAGITWNTLPVDLIFIL